MGERLVLDRKGCLRVQPGKGPTWVPVWSANRRLETGGETARVADKEGRIVAEVGKKVYMGGGQVGLPEEVISPSTVRALRDRCPGNMGDYWMAVDASRTPGSPPG